MKCNRNARHTYTDPCSDHTWKGEPILSSQKLDGLISNCDLDCEGEGNELLCPPFSAFRVLPPRQDCVDSIPDLCNRSDISAEPDLLLNTENDPERYSVACVESSPESLMPAITSVLGNPQDQTPNPEVFPDSLQLSIPPSIRAENRIDPTWAKLFHVYLNVVAPTLVPVNEARNPWLRYPAIALHLSFQEGRNHLLYALLAHAAFCLGHKTSGQDTMSMLGTNLYSSAMLELRACIQEGSTDYLGLLTTILTFVLAEVFSPTPGLTKC